MARFFTIFLTFVALAVSAGAATVENEFFSITTPDDSWFLNNDDALRPIGARVDIARLDARGATLELARVDYIEGAFAPEAYLKMQVTGKKDVFCKTATDFTSITEYSLAGLTGKCVQFKKTSNNYNYDCEAVALNAGFGTFFIVMAHRADQPSLISRIMSTLKCKVDTTPLTTIQAYVNAASQVVKKHHLPIGNNEHLSGVELSPDSSTVTLKVTVPYITRDNVNVPAFVMTKRDAWFKQAHEALQFNLLLAQVANERKNLRYFYVDTKGNEIGTLMIMPEELDYVEAEYLAQQQAKAKQEQAIPPQAQAAKPQEEPQQAAQPQETVAQVQEAAPQQPAQPQAELKPMPAPQQPTTLTHVVKSGDNLTKIAKKYGVTIASIRKANPSIKNDQIKIGQKLTIIK